MAGRRFDILRRLPADLMFNILLRLPVTSLRRCRCVSRRWRDVIDSRIFAKSHLNNLSDGRPSILIIREELFANFYDVLDLSSVWNGSSPPAALKELPVPGPFKIPSYVDHCNGLFCISGSTGVSLWNPATGKQFQFGLPEQGREVMWDWGFGYDEDSDDFKVVAMAQEAVGGGYLVWIYSLRSRSWKRIGDFFPYSLVGLVRCGVFFSGALHWIVHQLGNYVYSIGALHLGKLEYNLLTIPDYNSEQNGKYLSYFGVLDGHLYVIYYSTDYDQFDLWTMKEYGVKESWTKLSIDCHGRRLRPLAYVEDEEVLVFNTDRNKILGYEFKTRSFRVLIEEPRELLESYIYVPSLFIP